MKKILLTIFAIGVCFICSNKVNALECLYEAEDGEQIVLSQYYEDSWYWPEDSKAVGTILPGGSEVNLVNNKSWLSYTGFANDWEEVKSCPKYIRGNSSSEKSACNNLEDCSEKGKIYYLHETYSNQTPNFVNLNEMRCTYVHKTHPEVELKHEEPGQNIDLVKPSKKNTYSFILTENDIEWRFAFSRNYHEIHTLTMSKDEIDAEINQPNNEDIDDGLLGWFNSGIMINNYYNSITPRTFWDDQLNYYKCPTYLSVITTSTEKLGQLTRENHYIAYEDIEQSKDPDFWDKVKDKFNYIFGGTNYDITYDVYILSETASYIDYTIDNSESGKCNYTVPSSLCDRDKEPDCQPATYMTLNQIKFTNGKTEYYWTNIEEYVQGSPRDYSEYDYPDIIGTGVCGKAPAIYTNCIGVTGTCEVSTTYKTGFTKLVPDVWTNTQDITDADEGMGSYNGLTYKELTCSLADKLKVYTNGSVLKGLPNLVYYNAKGSDESEEYYNITNLPCSDWSMSTGFNCSTETCKNTLGYTIERQVRDIKDYCTRIYNRYIDNTSDQSNIARKDECLAFDNLYTDMVEKGIINDLSIGCDFVTSELAEKLKWVLDLLKIAGPIAALGLGTLDFVKAIASGDSDKEMKSAFKRFTTRMIAAALLFIVPLILAFMMDTFIGNQDGYDPGNPFCNVVDWTD